MIINDHGKLFFYQQALSVFKKHPRGPYVCLVLCDIIIQSGYRALVDQTSAGATCKRIFPEFYKYVEAYDPGNPTASFPDTNEGNEMRKIALQRAIAEVQDNIRYRQPSELWEFSKIHRSFSCDFINGLKQYDTIMKNEQLDKGNELKNLIETAKTQLNIWQKAMCPGDSKISVSLSGYSERAQIQPHHFQIIKELSISYLRNLLIDLEKQFNEL